MSEDKGDEENIISLSAQESPQDKTHQKAASIDENNPEPFKPINPSIVRVAVFAIAVTLVVTSLLLNFSFLFSSETQDTKVMPNQNILMIGLMILTAASLLIIFWNYHIRSIYLKDGPALVPEQWGLLLSNILAVTEAQHDQSQSTLKSVVASSDRQTQNSQDLMQSFLTLQAALSSRDEEIARLRKNYDSKVFKRFLNRFIRVSQALEELEPEFKETGNQKNHRYISRLIEGALEECGVEQFTPEAGVDYRDAGSEIADDPAVIETDDANLDFIISHVDRPGYQIVGQEETEIIVPSRVTIYRQIGIKGE